MNNFIKSILAGILISIGGCAYVLTENKFIGATLFCIGLFFILSFNLNLYTGKIGYLVVNKISYIKNLLITLAGNFVGTLIVSNLLNLTRGDFSKVNDIVNVKLSDSYISILILSIFCGVLMFLGVHGYKTLEDCVGKHLSIFFAVIVFILCGFEHCIANMFYLGLANEFLNLKTWIYLLIMILGNSLGSIITAESFKKTQLLK